tara:strand:- start:76 stop:1308 length:1233 start_codon:yes stop_codon:yes gene_type:complete
MKKTDKNFSDHELYDDVVHGLKSPYIRLSDIKLRNEKTPAKKWSNKLSREISSGTHYYLTHELLDVLLPSLKKLSVRHFVNAFYNAMAPHKNFFIEWDALYMNNYINAENPHLLFNEYGTNPVFAEYGESREVRFGVSSTYVRPSVVSYADASRGGFWVSENRKDTHIPEGQKLSFFALHSNGNREQMRKKHYKKRIFMSNQSIHLFGLENNTCEKYFREVSEKLPDDHKLFMHWFGIETFSDLMSSGLSDVVNLLRIFPHEGVDYIHYEKLGDKKDAFIGIEFYSLLIYVAAMSLLNYDWVVNEEDGVIARGTKSVNTEAFPQDKYKRVTINLPKDKAIKLFAKQKARTRKFGTAQHTVRGHWRFYKKTGERVWIGEHSRGDSKYGTVHKDYTLTKRGNYLKANTKKVA